MLASAKPALVLSRAFSSFIFLILLISSAQAAGGRLADLSSKNSNRDSIENNDSANLIAWQNSSSDRQGYNQRTTDGNSPLFNFADFSNLLNSLTKSTVPDEHIGLSSSDNRVFLSNTIVNTSVINPVDCTTSPISFGQTINESVSTSDCTDGFRYYDKYSFTGVAGQNIAVTLNSTAFDTWLQLYNSNGQWIASRLGFSEARLIFTLPSEGAYTIIATSGPQNLTGGYSITFTNNGICTSTVTAVNVGETKNGALSTSDCVFSDSNILGNTYLSYYDDYTFIGTSGQKIILTLASTDFNTGLQLYNSAGQLLANSTANISFGNSSITYTLPTEGTYRIRVQISFSSANLSGAYTLGLFNDIPCAPTTPINLGQTVNGALSTTDCISGSGYADEYIFNATTGRRITITMDSTDFPTRLELYASTGQQITFRNGLSNTFLLLNLATGTYRIRATSSSINRTGGYTLSLIENNCATKQISSGNPINDSLSTSDCQDGARLYDNYRFSGRAGGNIIITMDSTAFTPYLLLFNSNNQIVASNVNGGANGNARIVFSLPADGVYTILATSNLFNQTGAYTLALNGDSVCNETPISFGQTIKGSLSTGCGTFRDDYLFNGVAGQRVIITMNSTAFTSNLSVCKFNGNSLQNCSEITGSPARLLYTLPFDGTYRIGAESEPLGRHGTYTLTLENAGVCTTLDPTPISFGETKNSSLSTTDCITTGGYYDEYTFSGVAGQNITISTASTDFTANLEVSSDGNPSGRSDASAGDTSSRLNFKIIRSGINKIRVTSLSPNQIGSYTITLVDNTPFCLQPPLRMAAWFEGEEGSFYSAELFRLFGISGKVGLASYFDESNYTDYFSGFSLLNNNFSEQVTLAAWIKPAAITGDQNIVSKRNGNGDGNGFRLSLSGGKLYFQVNQTNSVSRSYITANPVISAGIFQHIAASFNPSTQQMEIYVNGVSVPVTLVNAETVTSIHEGVALLNLGVLTDGNQYTQKFGGYIDEMQIFDRALSASEIQSIYNAGSAGVCAFTNISGKIITTDGRPLRNVPVSTADGSKTVYTARSDGRGDIIDGGYSINLEPGYNQTIKPKLSTHSFSPSDYSFTPLIGNQTEKDFTATLLNDNFADAVQLTGESGEVIGSNQDATRETDEPLHAEETGASSVWYRWRAPRNGQFAFSLGDSRFDTLLAVYTGATVGNLTPIAANDNISSAATSRLTFTATANTDYWIAVDGRMNGSGFGFFKLIYYPADYTSSFTVSGIVKDLELSRFLAGCSPISPDIRGLTIKAESLNGEIIATAITEMDGRYSITIPKNITNFRLTAGDYGYKIFSNIAQNQIYNFIKPPCPTCPIIVCTPIIGKLFGVDNSSGNVTLTALGHNTPSIQCSIDRRIDPQYVCQELITFGTYTLIPSHPSVTFSPVSRTFADLRSAVSNANFNAVVGAGFTINGKVTQGNTPLAGVKVNINAGGNAGFLETETDVAGNYSLTKLSPGNEYRVSARLPGFNLQALGTSIFTNLQNNQTVNFTASSDCSYTISPLEQNIPSAGGFYTFNISVNTGCPWQAKTSSAGITVTSPLSYGNGTVSYFVEPHTGAARTITITVAGQTVRINQSSAASAPYDFDGDGKSDVSVFRPSAGSWYLLQSSSGSFFGQSFGLGTDIIVPADYDGDGMTDFAVFRPDSGSWYLQQSTSGFTGVQFGQNGDIPIPADYDGDGEDDIAVYRPSTGGWYRLNSSNGQFVAVAFGAAEDKPAVGDYDGDGKADIAVFRPSTANWFRLNSSNNQFVAVQFGSAEDKLTPADFDGDGKTDIAVFRSSTGGWYRFNSSNGEFVAVGFGTAEDQPVAADYDGDGKADIAVFRPSDSNWYLLRSTAGFTAVQFGVSQDKPVPSAFVR